MHLLQLISSDRSRQSSYPSHFRRMSMQVPSEQRNSLLWHSLMRCQGRKKIASKKKRTRHTQKKRWVSIYEMEMMIIKGQSTKNDPKTKIITTTKLSRRNAINQMTNNRISRCNAIHQRRWSLSFYVPFPPSPFFLSFLFCLDIDRRRWFHEFDCHSKAIKREKRRWKKETFGLFF